MDIEIEKNFVYEDTVVCLIEIYDQDQVLQVSATRNINANLIPVKQSLKIPLNYPLPESFDNQTWQVKVSLLSSVE